MSSGSGVVDRQGRADELQEQKVAETEPEQVDADTAYSLLGLQGHADEGGHDAHHGADAHPDEDGEKDVAGLEGGEVGGEGRREA